MIVVVKEQESCNLPAQVLSYEYAYSREREYITCVLTEEHSELRNDLRQPEKEKGEALCEDWVATPEGSSCARKG